MGWFCRLPIKRNEATKTILDNIDDVVAFLNDNFEFQYVNEAFHRVLGYNIDDLTGRYKIDIIHPEDAGIYIDAAIKAFKMDKQITTRARIRRKSGTYVWFEFVIKQFIHENGIVEILAIGKRIPKAHSIVKELMRRFSYMEPKILRKDSPIKHEKGFELPAVIFKVEVYGL